MSINEEIVEITELEGTEVEDFDIEKYKENMETFDDSEKITDGRGDI